MFIWPPGWSLFDISISIPLLTAYAKSRGLKSCQYDACIDFAHHLFSRAGLQLSRPRTKDPTSIGALWNFLYQNIDSIWDDVSGDAAKIHLQTILMNSGYYYYAFRHTHPVLGKTLLRPNGVFIAGLDSRSSSNIIRAVKLLASLKSHPLTRFYRNTVIPRIRKTNTRILGISLASDGQLIPAILLAALVKKSGIDCHITIGGDWINKYIAGVQKKNRFFNSWVDSYVFGDGEPALDGFKRYLDGKCSLAEIDNIMIPRREPKKSLVFTDLNNLPAPEFDPSALKKYIPPLTLPVELSRGCYWGKCAFCPQIEGVNAHFRPVETTKALDQVKYLKARYQVNRFVFSTVAATPKQLSELTSYLANSKIDISWSIWFRMDKALTDNILKAMKKTGCISVWPAPESLNQRTLDLLGKGYRVENIIRIMKTVMKLGYESLINVLTAFPGEREEDLTDTLELCKKHKFNPVFFPFQMARNSIVAQHPKRFGVTLLPNRNPDIDLEDPVNFRINKNTPHYDWNEVRKKLMEKYKDNFYTSKGPIHIGDQMFFDRPVPQQLDDHPENIPIYPLAFRHNGRRCYAMITPHTGAGSLLPADIYLVSKSIYADYLATDDPAPLFDVLHKRAREKAHGG